MALPFALAFAPGVLTFLTSRIAASFAWSGPGVLRPRATKMRAALEALIARGRSTPGPDQANDAPILLVKKVNTPGAKAKAKGKAIDTDK